MPGRRCGRVQPADKPTSHWSSNGDWKMKAFSPIARAITAGLTDGWVIDLMAPLFDDMAPIDRKRYNDPSLDVPETADYSASSIQPRHARCVSSRSQPPALQTDERIYRKPAYADRSNLRAVVRSATQKIAPSVRIEDQSGAVTGSFLVADTDWRLLGNT